MSYIQLSCWTKGSHKNPKEPRLFCRPQVALYKLKARLITEGKKYSIYTMHWTWRSRASIYKEVVSRCSNVQKDTMHVTKRETNTKPAQNHWSTMLFCLQEILEKWWHKFVGVKNQFAVWLKDHSMRWNVYLILLVLLQARD